MRKLVLIVCILLPLYGVAQVDVIKGVNGLITNKFVDITNGYHLSTSYENEVYSQKIGIPTYYTFDMVRMVGAEVEKAFSDLDIIQAWTIIYIDTTEDAYLLVYSSADDYYTTVLYVVDTDRLMISTFLKNL